MTDNQKQEDTKVEGNESDSKKTTPNENAFDPMKLSDEDLTKVFEDPRIWEHKRFKELNESAKAGKQALAQLKELKEKELEEQGKFKEIAEKHKAEAEEARKQLQLEKVNNILLAEAQKQGAVDTESVLKLADRSNIQVSEEGTISGADLAVKALLETKPFLKNANAGQIMIGSGTQPSGNETGVKKFTLSQIQNREFYIENEKDILQAAKTGNIINDVQGGDSNPGPLNR